jgi:predicted NAD-dependent protein-ADP-ribosyltransferase YbiA (DUF1768 family)
VGGQTFVTSRRTLELSPYLSALLSSSFREGIEAADNDTVWGIGLGMNDPRKEDPRNWRGTNWLGEVLTKLREDLDHEHEHTINKL